MDQLSCETLHDRRCTRGLTRHIASNMIDDDDGFVLNTGTDLPSVSVASGSGGSIGGQGGRCLPDETVAPRVPPKLTEA